MLYSDGTNVYTTARGFARYSYNINLDPSDPLDEVVLADHPKGFVASIEMKTKGGKLYKPNNNIPIKNGRIIKIRDSLGFKIQIQTNPRPVWAYTNNTWYGIRIQVDTSSLGNMGIQIYLKTSLIN